MVNTNCLEGIVCPECGADDDFTIEIKTLAHVTDDGAEAFGDMEWDERRFIECRACQTTGVVREFTVQPSESKIIMTQSPHFNAIRLNLAIMTVQLDRVSRFVDEAMTAANQNTAVGALLELPDKLNVLQALFGAIIAIHRNTQ